MIKLSKTIVSVVCAASMCFGTVSPAAMAAEEVVEVAPSVVMAEEADASVSIDESGSGYFSTEQAVIDTKEPDGLVYSVFDRINESKRIAALEETITPDGIAPLIIDPKSVMTLEEETTLQDTMAPQDVTVKDGTAATDDTKATDGTTATDDTTATEIKETFSETMNAPISDTSPEGTTAPGETISPDVMLIVPETTTPEEHALDEVENFVDWFYVCFLGRHAEPEGLEYWTSSLKDNSRTAADVAAGIMFSVESSVVGLSDRDYVIALYKAILNREPREDEIKVWVDVLDRAYSRKKIVDGFFGSDEFKETCKRLGIKAGSFYSDDIADLNHDVAEFIARFYRVCLNRRFDKEGLDAWVRTLVEGNSSGAVVAWGFLDSEEYKARKRSDEDYIEDLYNTFLGRPSDAEGKKNWVKIASMNFTRKYLAQGFAGSDEFGELCKAAGIKPGSLELEELRDLNTGLTEMVNGLYKNLLKKDGKVAAKDIEYWIEKAKKENNIIDVVKNFFNSDEYVGRNTGASQYVKDVYRCLLFRDPEDATLQSRSQELKNGDSSRDEVLSSIISSEEFSIVCASKGIPLVVEGWSDGKFYVNGKAYTGWKTVDGYRRYLKNGVLLTDLDDVLGNTHNYVLKINRVACTVTAYAYNTSTKKYDIPAKVSVCTPGAEETPTTAGTFYISDQYRWKELMGPCWGQWCSRFNGGMLFHSVYYAVSGDNKTLSVSAYNRLGKVGSHGCCRVPASMAYWIYYHCGSGTKVVVYDSSDPGPLGKPATIKLPSWHTWDPTDPTAYKYCQANGCH
ncbi:MAG: DUF4214 domain-containing protein [Lachnospiraceae bacterium]|nr:DUF4214 domain-containing protein [Lachnospiraceae bacterium]